MVTALSRHAYSWAIDLGLEPIDAQDVAQSAIEVLLRKADTVERGVVTVWLWRVVLHKAQELRRCRREALLATERQPDRAAPDPDPEVTLRSAELGAAVQRALAEIPASKRRILEAVALEERSLAEVAREEGVPESTVRSRLQVATDQLRGSLERRRREESRRTGGHTSWLLLPWAGDVRAGWRALAALGATAAVVAGGALLHISPPSLGPTEIGEPARAAQVYTVQQATPLPSAERGAEREASVGRGRAAPGHAPRRRHDVAARMLAERLAHPR